MSSCSYNFTLCVSKEASSSCASLKLTVKSGQVPTFHLAAKENVVNPLEETIIKGEEKPYNEQDCLCVVYLQLFSPF